MPEPSEAPATWQSPVDGKRLAEIRQYLSEVTLGYQAPDGRKFAAVVNDLLRDREALAARVNQLEELLTAPDNDHA